MRISGQKLPTLHCVYALAPTTGEGQVAEKLFTIARTGVKTTLSAEVEVMWSVEGRCPLVGHLLLILVSLGTGGAIQLQHGVDPDFPDSLSESGLLCADGEFALVFVAALFAFNGDVGAFGEGSSEVGQFP